MTNTNGPPEIADPQGCAIELNGRAAEAKQGRLVGRVEICRPMHNLGDVVMLIERLVAVEFAGLEVNGDAEVILERGDIRARRIDVELG